MGNLPDSRTITIADGDPIPGSIIGEIEDCIIGGKQGARWEWFLPLGRAASEINMGWDSNGFIKATSGGAQFDFVPVRTAVGDQILQIGVRMIGTGAGLSPTLRLYSLNNGARANPASINIPVPAAAWATYTTVSLGGAEFAENVLDGVSYIFEMDVPTTGQGISAVGIKRKRP